MELRARPFVAADRPTLADIAIYTSVEYLRLAQFDSAPFPAIAAWHARCAQRPGWSLTTTTPSAAAG
jgi:glutathione S-transferase